MRAIAFLHNNLLIVEGFSMVLKYSWRWPNTAMTSMNKYLLRFAAIIEIDWAYFFTMVTDYYVKGMLASVISETV